MATKKLADSGIKLSTGEKIIVILMGGLLLGAMWRIRGDDGFGSFWGMLPCSLAFWMFLISVFGYRKKFSYDLLPFMVVSIPMTINGWMPVIPLLKGVIETPSGFENFNYFSAVILIFAMGFAWMTFLGFFLGVTFSNKRYRVRDFIFFAVLYFAVAYAFRAVLAHGVIKVIAPQAVDAFARGLAEKGNPNSPFRFYLSTFLTDSSAIKQFVGGRTYSNSISNIAYISAALSVAAALLIKYKDKLAAKMMVTVNSLVGVSFLLSALINVLSSDGFRGNFDSHGKLPVWFMSNYWGVAEYSFGLFIGIFVTAYLLFRKPTAKDGAWDLPHKLPDGHGKKSLHFVYHLLFTLSFMLAAAIIRPIGSRLDHGSDGAINSGTVTIIGAVIFLIIFVPILMRNLLKKGLAQPFSPELQSFAMIASPVILTIYCIIDLFIGWPFWEQPTVWPLYTLVGGSTVIVCILYAVMHKKLRVKGLSKSRDKK